MEASRFETLLAEAEGLAGRKLEVDRTKDGKFIVLFMRFGSKPPPKAGSREEALEVFIEYMKINRPVDPGTEGELRELRARVEADERGEFP